MAASATGHFIVAPAAAEWKQPLALGGGDQTEFQLPITCTGSGPCIMYVASPGGAVAHVDNYPNGLGAPLGRDDVGLSAWYDFSKSVRYTGFDTLGTRAFFYFEGGEEYIMTKKRLSQNSTRSIPALLYLRSERNSPNHG